MLYRVIKFLAKSALIIYFRKITFNKPNCLNENGPLLLACNHSNSFLDAVILGACFRHPVYFLARGDAFKKPFAKKILTALKVIPIYRLSEGKEHLALNDTTFEQCNQILLKGGIVLIFSEGLCENGWKLRPLKKGTARISLNAWKHPAISETFRIMPISFNYSSFDRFRKRVYIDFGDPILKQDSIDSKPEGENIVELNKLLFSCLEKGLITEHSDTHTIQFLLSNPGLLKGSGDLTIQLLKAKQLAFSDRFEYDFENLKGTKKVASNYLGVFTRLLVTMVLIIPAVLGLLLHSPLYFPVNNFICRKTRGTVFYHSALFGMLLLIYPVYALIIAALACILFGNAVYLSIIIVMPITAFLFLYWVDCIEEIVNFLRLPADIRRKISGEAF